jgi:hypothetical protein
MKIRSAPLALRERENRLGKDVAASRASHHVVIAGHAGSTALERLALGFVEPRFDAVGRWLRKRSFWAGLGAFSLSA